MSSVLARFQLSETKRIGYTTMGANGKTHVVEATHITLAAVKGDPFGPATPQGQITALIVNPSAAKVFCDAPIGAEFDIVIKPKEQSHGKETV